ncbi:class I SAM-dependent methyltransferase [Brachybacterium endophyticum]|uniref:Class I SAM-dependent methyltransferase n=2 Tax=Brachybacterium endophyticum TaxID=2182385 RepID=A0A2U2RPY2_9MICO|nr:class I SAM-dependent methyltransferase [Brachybacterium endophyticum]
MQALNARHPWNHNDHFHSWILHELPPRRRAALDVGCGQGGLLLELAPWFDAVTGIDRDPGMLAAADRRTAHVENIEVGDAPLEELDGPYDLITMVAVLHHLDLEEALAQVRRLLAPGGRFLSVGLAPPVTTRDHLWDVASMVTNPLIGKIKHPWRPPREIGEATGAAAQMPIADPTLPLDEMVARAQAVMPGLRAERHLGFRHTLAWTKPGPVTSRA